MLLGHIACHFCSEMIRLMLQQCSQEPNPSTDKRGASQQHATSHWKILSGSPEVGDAQISLLAVA